MESTEATTATMTSASASASAARQSGAGDQHAERCGCQQRDHHFA
jgi:hypothetical protein